MDAQYRMGFLRCCASSEKERGESQKMSGRSEVPEPSTMEASATAGGRAGYHALHILEVTSAEPLAGRLGS